MFSFACESTTTPRSGSETFSQMPLVPEKGIPCAIGAPESRTAALSPLSTRAPRWTRQSSACVDLPVPLGAVKSSAPPSWAIYEAWNTSERNGSRSCGSESPGQRKDARVAQRQQSARAIARTSCARPGA